LKSVFVIALSGPVEPGFLGLHEAQRVAEDRLRGRGKRVLRRPDGLDRGDLRGQGIPALPQRRGELLIPDERPVRERGQERGEHRLSTSEHRERRLPGLE